MKKSNNNLTFIIILVGLILISIFIVVKLILKDNFTLTEEILDDIKICVLRRSSNHKSDSINKYIPGYTQKNSGKLKAMSVKDCI